MAWTCPSCYNEGNEGIYCICGHKKEEEAMPSAPLQETPRKSKSFLPSKKDEIILPKKDLIKSMFKEMLLHGKFIQSQVDEVMAFGKENGCKEDEIRGIYEEVKKEVHCKAVSALP